MIEPDRLCRGISAKRSSAAQGDTLQRREGLSHDPRGAGQGYTASSGIAIPWSRTALDARAAEKRYKNAQFVLVKKW